MSFDADESVSSDETMDEAAETVAPIITVSGVSKHYFSYSTPRLRLWELITGRPGKYATRSTALNDVSFSLQPGDRLGVVGENGSGKSTLLKVISQVLTPTTGSVRVGGRISALLELGTGFNMELTGRENIRQFGLLHGLSNADIDAVIDDIIAFSELGPDIDRPVRTYSSGMGVRLGFACAVHVQPDILIVDEALSVGDAYFQVKCLHKIRDMLDQGVTFIYVTHAADSVRSLCNKGLWLDHGHVRAFGPAKEVGDAYQAEMFRRITAAGLDDELEELSAPIQLDEPSGSTKVDPSRAQVFAKRVESLRTGSGQIRFNDVEILDTNGQPTDSVAFEQDLQIRIHYSYIKAVDLPVDIGVGITDARGVEILHYSLSSLGRDAREIGAGTTGVIDLRAENILCPGEFNLSVGANTLVEHPSLTGRKLVGEVIDYCVGGARFQVCQPAQRGALNLWGIVRSNFNVAISES